jgi:hypothetical protein
VRRLAAIRRSRCCYDAAVPLAPRRRATAAAGNGRCCHAAAIVPMPACIELVAPETYRLAPCDDERQGARGKIQIGGLEATVTRREPPSSMEDVFAVMSDPLGGFDWYTLYERYDAACKRFNPRSVHLSGVVPTPATDRELYYWLVQTAAPTSGKRPVLDKEWYQALLYWKLYSPRPASGITGSTERFALEPFRQLLKKVRETVSRNIDSIIELVNSIGKYQVPGMASSDALPVRTTFLHMLYPAVVPIFDRMVLKAVGVRDKGANKKRAVLRQYVPHAWTLAARHTEQLRGFRESPVRLVDMALWV